MKNLLFGFALCFPLQQSEKIENVNILVNALDIITSQTNQTFNVHNGKLKLLETINYEGTIFVPTDEAWFKEPVNIWEDIVATKNRLRYHSIRDQLIFKTISFGHYSYYMANNTEYLGVTRNDDGEIMVRDGSNSNIIKVVGWITIRKLTIMAIDTVLTTPEPIIYSPILSDYPESYQQFFAGIGNRFTLFLPEYKAAQSLEAKHCPFPLGFGSADISSLMSGFVANETLFTSQFFEKNSLSTKHFLSSIPNFSIDIDIDSPFFNVTGKSNGTSKYHAEILDSDLLVSGGVIHRLQNITFYENYEFNCEPYIIPAPTNSTCMNVFQEEVFKLFEPCGINPTVLSSFGNDTLDFLIHSLDTICSKTCNDQLVAAQNALLKHCAGVEILGGIDLRDIFSLIDAGYNAICMQTIDDGYCVQAQWPTLKPIYVEFLGSGEVSGAIVTNTTFMCTDCVYRQVKEFTKFDNSLKTLGLGNADPIAMLNGICHENYVTLHGPPNN